MNEINFNIEDIEKIDLSMDVGIKEIYPPLENLEVTPTKEQQVFTHENSYGYDNVTVNPIPEIKLQDKDITINENGIHSIVADDEYDGLNQVNVTVDAIEDLTEELETYNNELTTQETTIDNLIETLKNKGIGEAPKYAPRYISFRGYTGTELDNELANLDTSNMTSMKQMFYNSSKLLELDLSDFNVSNVNDITEIFYGCSKLKKLRLNNWDTSAVTNMVQAFRMCGSLTELDLSGWVLSDNVNISDLFYQCYALAKLDIRNFTFDKVGRYVDTFVSLPSNCEIIVKSDVERDWILTNCRSNLTNIKTVAEL